jgi:hypothetical protein
MQKQIWKEILTMVTPAANVNEVMVAPMVDLRLAESKILEPGGRVGF